MSAVEFVVMWSGVMCAVGLSLFICGLGVQFLSEQMDQYWTWLAKRARADAKAWVLFKRVQRRYHL